MDLIQGIILGVVEGLTEFLPISSTGHLILTKPLLGIESNSIDAYLIVIQLGATLACAGFFWKKITHICNGIFQKDPEGLRTLGLVIIAFFPAAIMGLLFEKKIDAVLFGPLPVAMALIFGGIVMIVFEKKFHSSQQHKNHWSDISTLDALAIGCAQCFSLWPGMSRSMTTILGGKFRGLNNTLSSEFSFFLALPTLGGATVYKFLKHREEILSLGDTPIPVIAGLFFSFIIGGASIIWFLKVVNKYGLAPFGYYRIMLGIFVLYQIIGK